MTKVLVVDDEQQVRELLVDILVRAGYDAIEAENGQVALEQVDLEQPDIVLLDVMMPVMGGLEVLGRLRGNPSTERTSVILLTAYPAARAERTAIEFGVGHCLSKPWRRGTIEATIEMALREAGPSSEDIVDPCGSMISTGTDPLDEKLAGGLPLGS